MRDTSPATIGRQTARAGLMLLPVGLLSGLTLSLIAFVPLVPPPALLADYGELPRRLLRLGHIAAVMLPLMSIVLGPWIDRVSLSSLQRRLASRLLLAGAIGLPLSLWVEAFSPWAARHHLAAPAALATTAATLLLAWGAYRGLDGTVASAAGVERAPTQRPGPRLRSLVEGRGADAADSSSPASLGG